MNLKRRLILLLGDPDISQREFEDVKQWLRGGGLAKCLRDAEDIRKILLHSHNSSLSIGGRKNSQEPDDPAVAEVSRLLRIEAGMTARSALDLLADALGREVRFPERIGFADGVLRLVREYGPSSVVAAAQQIRNQEIHGSPTTNWPLRHGR